MTGGEASALSNCRGFDSQRLEAVFNRCFRQSLRTVLVGGAAEPFYLPAAAGTGLHELHYREDFFASALHETAHWCIAGEARRRLADFGYWYDPDGRDHAQQIAFQQVERKPQALEWVFAKACDFPFRVSVDNLDGDFAFTSGSFAREVLKEAHGWQARGLPERAQAFFDALAIEFGTGHTLAELRFSQAELR